MFGNTLEEVMELQKDRFPYRKLPWIQITLSQQVIVFLAYAIVMFIKSIKNIQQIHFNDDNIRYYC